MSLELRANHSHVDALLDSKLPHGFVTGVQQQLPVDIVLQKTTGKRLQLLAPFEELGHALRWVLLREVLRSQDLSAEEDADLEAVEGAEDAHFLQFVVSELDEELSVDLVLLEGGDVLV